MSATLVVRLGMHADLSAGEADEGEEVLGLALVAAMQATAAARTRQRALDDPAVSAEAAGALFAAACDARHDPVLLCERCSRGIRMPRSAAQRRSATSASGCAAAWIARPAGPEMPAPWARSSGGVVSVSAVARGVSVSSSVWMPSQLRAVYPALIVVRMRPY